MMIRLDAEGVKALIGELVELMPVVIGDEHSGRDRTPVPDVGGAISMIVDPQTPDAEADFAPAGPSG